MSWSNIYGMSILSFEYCDQNPLYERFVNLYSLLWIITCRVFIYTIFQIVGNIFKVFNTNHCCCWNIFPKRKKNFHYKQPKKNTLFVRKILVFLLLLSLYLFFLYALKPGKSHHHHHHWMMMILWYQISPSHLLIRKKFFFSVSSLVVVVVDRSKRPPDRRSNRDWPFFFNFPFLFYHHHQINI